MCSAVRRKVQTVLFTGFHKKVNVVLGIHGPGSNRVRMKSHYSYWLVSQSCPLTSLLFLECGRSWTFSSVAAGAGAGAGPSAVGAGAGPSAISAALCLPRFLPFFLQNTELDREVFCVVMKTWFDEILLTELCRTKFLLSLQVNEF